MRQAARILGIQPPYLLHLPVKNGFVGKAGKRVEAIRARSKTEWLTLGTLLFLMFQEEAQPSIS